jgi:phosphoglycerol transferase MdoB-like AlkP superfamily enzyme
LTKDNGSNKLLERVKKDYTANVLLSQTVSKHLLYAMGDIENLLKELFTEMKNQDPSSLPIELKKIKWQDLAIKVFQEYSKIELY